MKRSDVKVGEIYGYRTTPGRDYAMVRVTGEYSDGGRLSFRPGVYGAGFPISHSGTGESLGTALPRYLAPLAEAQAENARRAEKRAAERLEYERASAPWRPVRVLAGELRMSGTLSRPFTHVTVEFTDPAEALAALQAVAALRRSKESQP